LAYITKNKKGISLMSAIKKTKLNSKGFSHFELVLLIVVIAVIAGVGLFVYNKNNNKSKADSLQADTAKVNARSSTTIKNPSNEFENLPLPVGDIPNDNPAYSNSSFKGIRASSASVKKWLATSVGTNNRAGYKIDTASSGKNIEYVTSDILVPKFNCSKQFTSSDIGVNIGKTQGTQRIVDATNLDIAFYCNNGKPNYLAEAYYGSNYKGFAIDIKGGQKVNIGVGFSGGTINYSVRNLSTNKSESYQLPCLTGRCDNNAASAGLGKRTYSTGKSKGEDIPMVDFGKIQMSGVNAKIQGYRLQTFGEVGLTYNLYAQYMLNTEKPGGYYLAYVSNPLMGENSDSFNAVFVKSN
jgi:Tfp pilus assembly major pilin PilA